MIVNDPNIVLWVKQCITQTHRVNGALGSSRVSRDGSHGDGYKRRNTRGRSRGGDDDVGRNLDVKA